MKTFSLFYFHGMKLTISLPWQYRRYSCEDHFLELDTFLHSEQTLALLLKDETLTKDILCDIGMTRNLYFLVAQ